MDFFVAIVRTCSYFCCSIHAILPNMVTYLYAAFSAELRSWALVGEIHKVLALEDSHYGIRAGHSTRSEQKIR